MLLNGLLRPMELGENCFNPEIHISVMVQVTVVLFKLLFLKVPSRIEILGAELY